MGDLRGCVGWTRHPSPAQLYAAAGKPALNNRSSDVLTTAQHAWEQDESLTREGAFIHALAHVTSAGDDTEPISLSLSYGDAVIFIVIPARTPPQSHQHTDARSDPDAS